MPAVFTELLASKKFIFVLLLSALLLVACHYGVLTKAEVLGLLGVLWPVYLGAQGVADVGSKIAAGRVTQETMLGHWETARQASIISGLVETFLPVFQKAMEAPYANRTTFLGGPLHSVPPAPRPMGLRALKKGDRFITLTKGPGSEGIILEDAPGLSPPEVAEYQGSVKSFAGTAPKLFAKCSFEGKEQEIDRFDIVFVPLDTVLPKVEAERPSAIDLASIHPKDPSKKV